VPALTSPRCASVQGFSLHANTQVPAHRRNQLERLMRYTARGHVPGAPDPRRQRRSYLHLYAPVVRWHYRDSALANGTAREAGHPRALPRWKAPCAQWQCISHLERLKSRCNGPPSLPATPTALPYPILRHLSSTSQSRAAPCSVWLRGAAAGAASAAGEG
jgi:hypothetical protein